MIEIVGFPLIILGPFWPLGKFYIKKILNRKKKSKKPQKTTKKTNPWPKIPANWKFGPLVFRIKKANKRFRKKL